MTNTKQKPEQQTKKETTGNLGQKEAQLEKDKASDLSHTGRKSSESDKGA